MNRFRILFSGAALFAASTSSLWGQVPVVQPSEVVLRAPTSKEIPVVSPESAVPIRVVPQGNKAILRMDTGSSTPATGGVQPLSPQTGPALPAIVRPQTGDMNLPKEFAPQVKAPHPDVSLPTEVPIVKQAIPKRNGMAEPKPEAKPATVAPSVNSGVNQAVVTGPSTALPVIRVGTNAVPVVKPEAKPVTVAPGVNSGVTSGVNQAVVTGPSTALPVIRVGTNAVPVVKPEAKPVTVAPGVNPVVNSGVNQAVVTGPSTALPVIRVGTNAVPVVKPDALSAPERSPANEAEANSPSNSQDPVISGSERPEIALPPIKPGEEFPRMPKRELSTKPTLKQAATSRNSEPIFESVPVGTGAVTTQDPIPQPAIVQPKLIAPNPAPRGIVQPSLVQPAAPLLEQDLGHQAHPANLDQHGHYHAHPHEHHEHVVGESELGFVQQAPGQSAVGESYLNSEAYGECQQCGGAGCSHCGLGGWNSLGNRGMLNLDGGCDNGCFGLLPCAQNYFIADVLYWTRNGGDVVGTDFGGVYDYDWNFGTQVTMGTRVDPLYGHELSYFGLFDLDAGHTDVSPAGNIDARFTPGGGLTFADTSAFFDAVETTQTANSTLHSFQVNRVRLGWDVVQSHLGLRFISFEDEYRLQSRNLGGDTGLLALDARNNLIGPEVGIKLFYDVGRRISFSTHWKLGGYLNAYRTSTFLQNNGLTQVNNSDSGTGFSASFDLGANAHIHLTQRMRLRGGYGILWLWDVASVTGNFPTSLTPFSGTGTNDSESAIFHGTNVGFEYYW